jgi:hypothetical protein
MTFNLKNIPLKLCAFNLLLSVFLIASISNLNAEEISVEEFFCDSSLSGVTLSPDGSKYAALVPISGGTCSIEEDNDPKAARVLLVMDLKTGKPTLLSGTADNAIISAFFWLTNDRIGFYKQPTRGLDAYDLWAINSDGKKTKTFSAWKMGRWIPDWS